MGIAAWVVVLGRLAVGDPAPVSGPAPSVVVVWEAPASCPSQAEVTAAVARRVGERPVDVRARVVAVETGFAAALELRSETGTTTRSLASPAEGARLIGPRPQQAPWATLAAAPELAIVVHDPENVIYVDDEGMAWPDAGMYCNGAYSPDAICDAQSD